MLVILPRQVNRAVYTQSLLRQWVDLGFVTDACITRPETCGPEGAALALWMKDQPRSMTIISSYVELTTCILLSYNSDANFVYW